MSQPKKYTRSADFTKNHGSVQNDSLLNAEFDNIATTVNGLRTRQAILLRDDETVANGIIGLDNLTDALKNSLDTTVTDSALALETANSAKEEADQAIADSADAIATANQASAKADTALSTANDANTKSNNAVSTANSASTTANTAKETAESVVDQYNTAISTANSAVTTAGNAANTANEALSTANASSTTATEAKTIATNAQTIATNYSAEIINYEAKINATVATIPTQIDEGIEAKDIPGIVGEEVEKQIIVKQDITAEKIGLALGYAPADSDDLIMEMNARTIADETLQKNIDNINSNLAAVATSGKYSDLADTPALKTVATSGKYSDLSGTPSLATVATSGNYNDLSNKPTIPTVPTNISAFTNDTGYALQSDLNEEASTRSSADSTLQDNIDAVSTVANTALANTLPPQTGNANKFLTTDGTSASWASVPSDDTKLSLSGGTMAGDITGAGGTFTSLSVGGYTAEAVAESGTNYIRYSSGLQICWDQIYQVTTGAGAYSNHVFSYSKEFSGGPSVYVTFNTTSTAGAFGKCSCSVANVSTTSCDVRFFNGDTTTRIPSLALLAIGYWK